MESLRIGCCVCRIAGDDGFVAGEAAEVAELAGADGSVAEGVAGSRSLATMDSSLEALQRPDDLPK